GPANLYGPGAACRGKTNIDSIGGGYRPNDDCCGPRPYSSGAAQFADECDSLFAKRRDRSCSNPQSNGTTADFDRPGSRHGHCTRACAAFVRPVLSDG